MPRVQPRSGEPSRRSALARLAARLGVVSEYVDQTGRERRVTADGTRVALLAAMGVDASDESTARAALRALLVAEAERVLDPVCVLCAGETAVTPRLPGGAGAADWSLVLRTEDGAEHPMQGRVRRGADGGARIPLPPALPTGYHDLTLTLGTPGGDRVARQRLIVVPHGCPAPATVLGGERAIGITANLYSVRSATNWGAGDLGDLRALLAYAREVGAAFVGVNPLHAVRNRGSDISPYSPVSRLFRSVLYLDVAAIPELADATAVREHVESAPFQRDLQRLRDARHLDYGAVMALKRPVLEALHAVFVGAGAGSDRHVAYVRYCAAQGRALDDFATFCALEEALDPERTRGWRGWPAAYHDSAGAAVARFRETHARAVDLHRWLQFELDRQLGDAAGLARAAGLPIGVYQDLAIGTAPDGSDTWAFPDLFARGVALGAPPDPLAAEGQNWGLPPLDPHRLRETGYAYWVTLLRSALRHAGALRIDHVLGLFRQFWIPEGRSGAEGAYVRFPADDLLGIVALESTRAGAIVVGEDLGTVPPEVPVGLARWGLLSSRVLYFARDARGELDHASTYPRMALATANTHDLPTLAGFWAGRDIAIRREVGAITSVRGARTAHAERERERAALLRRLRADALIADDGMAPPDALTIRAATHAFLRRTPSWLAGLALDDLVGETEPVNVPGVGPDRFASWTRRLRTPLEALRTDPAVQRALGVERRWVPGAVAGAPGSVPGAR